MRFRLWGKNKDVATEKREPLEPSFGLKPLYAQSLDKEHQSYANTLINALNEDEGIKNVALTGSYGTGKSSILDAFEQKYEGRVIRVSFSSLGAKIEEKIFDSGDNRDSKTGILNNLTNLIQKEIVKQILFKESPRELPNSKFRRISKTQMRPHIFHGMFFAAITVLGLFQFGFLDPILGLAVGGTWYQIAFLVCFSFTVVSCVYVVLLVIIGTNIKLEKVSGGPLTFGLTGTNSYFDEYLDEILYFFETTKYDTVLIEDIDRFKKLYIFESLRQLSAIINGSKQVGKPIRFIYALKDSIFTAGLDVGDKNGTDNSDSAQPSGNELGLPNDIDQATNRTKFFDLIIPIVPFLAQNTSRNHIIDELNVRNISVKQSVIKIVAPELTDMRLIKNICNEFAIFHEKVLVESSIDSLKPENMFAITVYKNLFLEDFEKIKAGKSILNEVHRYSTVFIQEETKRLAIQQEELIDQKDEATGLNNRVKRHGSKLISYLESVVTGLGMTLEGYEFNNRTIDREYLLELDFWQELSTADEDVCITLVLREPGTRTQPRYKLTKSDIAEHVLGFAIEVDDWKRRDRDKLSRQINDIKKEMDHLQTMDIAGLMARYSTFSENLKDMVKNKMVIDLLEAGYIDKYFALYTSTYHTGNLSGNAMNFKIHNVDTQTMDLHYHFQHKQDVENLLREVGEIQLSNAALINIEVLDHLLNYKDSSRAHMLAATITKQDNVEEILDTYIRKGKHPTKLIGRAAPTMPTIFDYILSSKAIKNTMRWNMFNEAVSSLDIKTSYTFDEHSISKVKQHINAIHATKSNQDKVINNFVHLIELADIKLDNIKKFSGAAKTAVSKALIFEVNAVNLRAVLGNDNKLSLDDIRKRDEDIYRYVIDRAYLYVRLLKAKKIQYSITDKQLVTQILTDVSKEDADSIEEIVRSINPQNVFIEDINTVPKNIWKSLVGNVLVDTTLSNILAYYAYSNTEADDLDVYLAGYLEAVNGELFIDKGGLDEYDQEVLKNFVLSALNSSELSKKTKGKIAEDLCTVKIQPQSLTLDATTPIGELMGVGAITDDADNFNVIKSSQWSVIEECIKNSNNFVNYINDIDLSPELFEKIVSSDKISATIKTYIVKNLEQFETLLSEDAANALLDFTIKGSWRLTIEHQLLLYRFTKDQERRTKLFVLSRSNITSINAAQKLLAVMDEPFSKFAKKGTQPKLHNLQHNKELIAILEELGMVSGTKHDRKTGLIRVNMKRKW